MIRRSGADAALRAEIAGTDAPEDGTCPKCGEPLEDFTPCACIFGPVLDEAQRVTVRKGGFRTSMRQMVSRRVGRPGPKPKAKP